MRERRLIKKQHQLEEKSPVIILGPYKKGEIQPEPSVGHSYYAYDDGKIKPSREYIVKITGCVHAKKLNREMRKRWEHEVLTYYWLLSPYEDNIFYGRVVEGGEGTEWFCRTKQGGWHSFFNDELNWSGGELDTSGKLHKIAWGEISWWDEQMKLEN